MVEFGGLEGREQGRLARARENLAILLESRYPGLLNRATLDAVKDLATAEKFSAR